MNSLSALTASRPRPRRAAMAARSRANGATSSRGSNADGCSAISRRGLRPGLARPHPLDHAGRRRADRGVEPRGGNAHFLGQCLDLRPELGADRFDLEGERQRQVLGRRALPQEYGAVGEQAQAVEHPQPAVVVGDGVGGMAEQPNGAGIRSHRAGDQVDEHLGPGGVDAVHRDHRAGRHAQVLQPQRPQRLEVLDHVDQLDERMMSLIARRRPTRGGLPAPPRRPPAG